MFCGIPSSWPPPLFRVIFSVLILLLWYFYTAARKTGEREQASRDFSRSAGRIVWRLAAGGNGSDS
jgi:hypothetical protein